MNLEIPSFPMKHVSFQKIDCSDTSYCINPFPEDDELSSLCQSIARTGIIHAPIITHFQTIVAGRKRILAARKLNINSGWCTVLHADIPEEMIHCIALEETLQTRQLTTVEKTFFFRKILGHMNKEEAAEKFLPLMGDHPHPAQIDKLLDFEELEDPLLKNLHRGILDESVAREMLHCSFRDRIALSEIIESLGLGTGKQRKLFTTMRELATRQKLTITEILADKDIQNLLDHDDDNIPQKAAALMNLLEQKRYPLFNAANSEFNKFIGGLRLPKNARVDHSPAFEKDTVTLSIEFQDRKELFNTWQKIQPLLLSEK